MLRWNIPAVLHLRVLVELNKPSSYPGCISAPRPCVIGILCQGGTAPSAAQTSTGWGWLSSEEMQVKLCQELFSFSCRNRQNTRLKINLLMGSPLSKQLLCAKAALHLAVTMLLVLLWPCVA